MINKKFLNKWDKRFVELAELVASWSKDPGTKVGAVIVDQENRILALGYNGPPKYVLEPENHEEKIATTVHAELNAILQIQRPPQRATIYSTHTVCSQCAAAICQVLYIKKVFCPMPEKDFSQRWGWQYVEQMFVAAGIQLIGIPRGEKSETGNHS